MTAIQGFSNELSTLCKSSMYCTEFQRLHFTEWTLINYKPQNFPQIWKEIWLGQALVVCFHNGCPMGQELKKPYFGHIFTAI